MRKSILITGASSGIGQASVHHFSQAGYQVFATYRSEHDGVVLSQLPHVYPLKLDVTSSTDIEWAVQAVSKQVGGQGLYALINNAGVTYTAPFEYAEEARARQVLEVNLVAPYRITQAFLPLLKQHNAHQAVKARVINVASWAGQVGQPFIPFYNASKFGLLGLSESMYYDLGLLDIHVVVACPGITKTPLLERTTRDGVINLAGFPSSGQRFYQAYFDHYRTMSEGSSDSAWFLTPEQVANKLFRIVQTKRPKFKHNLALDAKVVDALLTRFIPFRWRAALNRRMFKLPR